MRLLVLSIGVTTQASSCILAVFLGGMALGAFVAGRVARRIKGQTLVAYGLVEVAVGMLAPPTSWLILQSPNAFVNLLHQLPEGNVALAAGRVGICSVLLLPPTVLMGASLPFLTRYLFEQKLNAPQFFSLLYGVNTLGGVFGTLAACYIGFTYFGLNQTIYGAALINLAVGILACISGRMINIPSDCQVSESNDANEATLAERGAGNPVLMALCLLGALTGFTAIGYEMLWTRMLRFSTTSTTYAFTAIVSMFLIGLALGSLLYNRWIKQHAESGMKEQLIKFAHIQYLTAIACSTSLACLPGSFLLRQSVPQLMGRLLPGNWIDPVFLAITTSLYMLIPATLIGISFPMIASICTALARDVSAAVGNVYAANTLGCVLGAAIVGLVLIPHLGSYSSFQIVVIGSTLTGALSVWLAGSGGGSRKIKQPLLLAGPLTLALLFFCFLRDPMPGMLSGLNLLKYGEDIAGTVMVLQWPDHKQLIMNGEGYSSTIFRGRRYMRLMGHLPVLLNASPEDALVICFGMGTTAGSVALYPEIKCEDIVELSPMVLQCAGLFTDTNYGVLQKEKVHTHIDDGRNYLLRCHKNYDVITLEPPPPTEAGIVNLYSKEFYQLLRRHLKPGGIACQWVPMSCESGSLWRGMVAAAVAVFPQVALWESNNGEAVLVCSEKPVKIDFQKLKSRMAAAKVKESLEDVGLGDPSALLSTFVCTGETLAKCVDGAKPLSDDHPYVEFFLPFADRNFYSFDMLPFVCDLPFANASDSDLEQFKTSKQAMMLLRQASRAEFEGKSGQAGKLLQNAKNLLPDNAFFKYAATHTTEAMQ